MSEIGRCKGCFQVTPDRRLTDENIDEIWVRSLAETFMGSHDGRLNRNLMVRTEMKCSR